MSYAFSKMMFFPKPLILLVDDEPTIHFLAGRFLREAGYFVNDAKDGAAGLRMFKERSWDLVITDRAMPGMKGEQLAEEIRNLSPDVPLMLITGTPKSNNDIELFNEILQKPFKRADLLAATARVLERKFVGSVH